MDFDEIREKLKTRFTFNVCLVEKGNQYYIASAQEDYASIMAFSAPPSDLSSFGGTIENQETLDNGLTLFTPVFDTSIGALAWFLFVFGGMKWTPTESRKVARFLLVTGTVKFCPTTKTLEVLPCNKS